MTEKRKEYQQQYREQYKSQAKRVNLTFSQDEYHAFSRAAKAENAKVTTYIKQLALVGLEQQVRIPEGIKTELKTLRFAIHNIVNNVNQIAHYSNTVRNMTMNDKNNLLQTLKQLDDVIQNYTEGRILLAQLTQELQAATQRANASLDKGMKKAESVLRQIKKRKANA